ncbi:hypothetical protein A2U01_0042807, partial [Trifolium medium]|nr:hypothetical protein [Trifolium medium]
TEHHEGDPEHEHHEAGAEAMEEVDLADDLLYDKEEHMKGEGVADKSVLIDYGAHIARCVYEDIDRDLIGIVSNGGKLFKFAVDIRRLKWGEPAIKAIRLSGLADI